MGHGVALGRETDPTLVCMCQNATRKPPFCIINMHTLKCDFIKQNLRKGLEEWEVRMIGLRSPEPRGKKRVAVRPEWDAQKGFGFCFFKDESNESMFMCFRAGKEGDTK